jgi:hypothetical protein
MVLVILLGGVMFASVSNQRNSLTANHNTTAYYASDSGVNFIVASFEEEIQGLFDTYATNPSGLTSSMFYSNLDALAASNATFHIDFSTSLGNTSYSDGLVEILGFDANGYKQYRVVSEGIVGDSSRTLEKILKYKYESGDGNGFSIDKAILTKNTIRLNNGVRVTSADPNVDANIGSYSQTAGTVILNGTITGDVYLLPGTNSNVVTNVNNSDGITKTLEQDDFPIVDFTYIRTLANSVRTENNRLPSISVGGRKLIDNTGNLIKAANNVYNNYTYVMPESPGVYDGYYVPEFIIRGENSFKIRVDHDTVIVTDRLWFEGFVEFIGEGTLTIYVKGTTTPTTLLNAPFKFPNFNNSSLTLGRIIDPQKFILFVDTIKLKGNVDLALYPQNGLKISGSFMFENASIYFSNNSSMSGYLVTGGLNSTISISNNGTINTSALYYVPNGSLVLSNNAVLNGAVVANSFTANNNARIIFNPSSFDNFPFQILDPITGIPISSGSEFNYEYTPTKEN